MDIACSLSHCTPYLRAPPTPPLVREHQVRNHRSPCFRHQRGTTRTYFSDVITKHHHRLSRPAGIHDSAKLVSNFAVRRVSPIATQARVVRITAQPIDMSSARWNETHKDLAHLRSVDHRPATIFHDGNCDGPRRPAAFARGSSRGRAPKNAPFRVHRRAFIANSDPALSPRHMLLVSFGHAKLLTEIAPDGSAYRNWRKAGRLRPMPRCGPSS